MLIFWLTLFSVYVLPVFLLWKKLLPPNYKFPVLLTFSILVLALMPILGFSAADLGIRTDNLIESVWPYSIFTLAGIGAILIIAKIKKHGIDENWKQDRHFHYLFIPISALQEFIFRGFFWPLAILAFGEINWLVISINVAVFAVMHILYPEKLFSLSFATIAGLSFALMYWSFPNLILISLSHAILNFIVVLYGFFSNTYKNSYVPAN